MSVMGVIMDIKEKNECDECYYGWYEVNNEYYECNYGCNEMKNECDECM